MMVFCIIFLVRYFYFGEVRDYDLRPLLKIKNGDPNFMGMYFSAICPFVFYKYQKEKRALFKWFLLSSLLVFLFSFVSNQSRMGMLAFLVAGIYWYKSSGTTLSRGKYLLGILSVIIIGYSFIQKIIFRFQSLNDTSNHERIKTLQAGIETFLDHPFFGVGWNRSSEYFYNYAGHSILHENGFHQFEIHNLFLKIAAELGFLGLGIYLILHFIILKGLLNNLSIDREMKRASIASFLILVLNGLTISPGYKEIYIILMGFLYLVGFHRSDLTRV
jgi:O-antigen ligase